MSVVCYYYLSTTVLPRIATPISRLSLPCCIHRRSKHHPPLPANPKGMFLTTAAAAHDLFSSLILTVQNNLLLNPNTINLSFPGRSPLFSRSLPISLSLSYHHNRLLRFPATQTHQKSRSFPRVKCLGTFVEHLEDKSDLSGENEADTFKFDEDYHPGFSGAGGDMKNLDTPTVEVKDLGELPEQWRRAKLAWLCKELPAHKSGTLVRILNAQRKWVRQEDATYVVVHCTRIRENEAGFKVYKWMIQQSWYRFDFALTTKLADYMGKERKYAKCREIFDDILSQGRVPSESTFHILVIAYLSAPVQGSLDEACSIYNRMIQLGGYRPRLTLHNALFRALVSKPESTSKLYLKQAEFIYHNLATLGLEIQKDIFGGLIWLHSHQDTVDKVRIIELRKEMKQARIEEGREVLVSILRACSKDGDLEEAERTWQKLVHIDGGLSCQVYVYRMEVFSKAGEPMKCLDVFREMQERLSSTSVAAYHKIIEVLCKAQEVDLGESLMQEFVKSDMKSPLPSFIDLMNMYLNLGLHEKLESAFSECLEKCRPNRTVYNIYLDSLVKVGNLDRAEEIFNLMCGNEAVGVNARSCNTILSGYLSAGDHVKVEKVYGLMCQKKYDVDSPLIEILDYALSLRRKVVKRPVNLKLSPEQREILVGLLLGGLQIVSDGARKKHMIQFDFHEDSSVHSVLRRHLHDRYHEWVHPTFKPTDGSDDIPARFSTIAHTCFAFYADQFWPKGRLAIPKLTHRWLSPRVLAYWYMYGGYRTPSGDILLKVKGSTDGVGKVVKMLKAKSLDCRVKRKGRVFWIGFLETDSTCFWQLIEPYILNELKDYLNPGDANGDETDGQNVNFDSGSDFDEEERECSDMDDS